MSVDLTRPTLESLRSYIQSCLGQGIFSVELTADQLDNAITDALWLYSSRIPIIGYRGLVTSPDIVAYPISHDIGFGIFDVQFVQPDPKPSALFYANLIDVAPVKPATMESYDIFLRWRRTFMKVTSVANHWQYDEIGKRLMIYSPIQSTKCCYFWHLPRNLDQVKLQHIPWVRKYAVAKAKSVLGKARSKFSGLLPGPARDMNLNGDSLQQEAAEEIQQLETVLLSMQPEVPFMMA
jgi:hypothetical protein